MLLAGQTSRAALVTDVAGHYKGQWDDTTFFPSGPRANGAIELDVMINDADVDLDFGLGGVIFGGAIPPNVSATFTGSVDTTLNTININTIGHPLFGDITGSINGDTGAVDVLMENLPFPAGDAVLMVEMTGMFTVGDPNQLTLSFTVTYTTALGLPPSMGTVNAAVPEPSSLACAALVIFTLAASRRRRANSR